jgi:hypothetical protein
MTPAELLKKYPPKVLARAARAERKKRERAGTVVSFDLDAFCGDHEYQRAVAHDMSPWQHWMWARQTGKTEIADGIMFDNANRLNPGSLNLFLGLTGVAVRTMNWEPKWQRRICEPAGVPTSWHNETRMATRMPNGSRIMFAGTDDLTHVRTFLGNSAPGGVIIIDEAQEQKDSVLRYILEQLLPPMLTPTTRVILAGVLPDVEAGYFYDLALPFAERALVAEVKGIKRGGWSLYECGRAMNTHTPNAIADHETYLRDRGLTWDDPQTARDWLMRRVWLNDALAYGYQRERDGYTPVRAEWEGDLASLLEQLAIPFDTLMAAVPWAGIDTFSVGIDPGGEDRFPVQVWGWGKGCPNVQHVFDFTPPRRAGLSWGQVEVVLKYVAKHYNPAFWFYDAGSGTTELDTFHRDTGIPAIKAAKKSDTRGQIRRVKNMFAEKVAKAMIGSSLEEDFRKARRDPSAPINGPWKWAPAWHPDPSEAARYALAPYWDTYKPPAEAKPQPTPYEEAMARMKEAAKKQGRIGYHAQQLRRGGQGGSSWS